jgi:SAM-dependent methyltransferase
MPTDDTPYDEDFFDAIHGESYASALAVVPRVIGLTGARSVVDVGSGSGAWSRVCREVGVPEVVGVDSASVPDRFREHHSEFIEHDLAEPLRLERQFGLAICVEVAEHVPPERAPGLVADLTVLAPVVLFSAAVPGQGGTGHLNEQWSEYWVALFEAEGWACRDAIRPWVRANPDVAWWYRQNLYLAVDPAVSQSYSSFPRLAAERPEHPVDYLVRPIGDLMVPPAPPPPPAPEQVVEPVDPANGLQPPTTRLDDDAGARPVAPAGVLDPVDAAGVDAAPDPPAAPPAESHEAAPAATLDHDAHPKPPGWDAMRRVAGRFRRRVEP